MNLTSIFAALRSIFEDEVSKDYVELWFERWIIVVKV